MASEWKNKKRQRDLKMKTQQFIKFVPFRCAFFHFYFVLFFFFFLFFVISSAFQIFPYAIFTIWSNTLLNKERWREFSFSKTNVFTVFSAARESFHLYALIRFAQRMSKLWSQTKKIYVIA